jgi:hypothetical protein
LRSENSGNPDPARPIRKIKETMPRYGLMPVPPS